MRIFRIAVASTLLSIATSVVVLTASAAHAAPFTYSSVNVGGQSACAVTTDSKVVCWGENFDQHLIPTRTDRYINSPTLVEFPEAIATVDVGGGSTHCALAVSGRAYCWGTGGHLGSYFTTVSRTPVRVEFPNDMRVRNVQNHYSNACALDTSRSLWCWGDPLTLGDGNVEPVRIPVHLTMPDNSPVAQYDMGNNGTCVVTDASHMYCWGTVNGYPSPWYNVAFPVVEQPAPAGTTWKSVQLEGERLCGITTNGSGYCRGDNYNGNFGNGTYDDSTVMTRMIVPNNESVASIHMGSYSTCITTTVNGLWCVGEGGSGQLGTGTTLGGRTWRQPVFPAGVSLTGISMHHSGTCGLDASARIWCWAYIANYELNGGLVFNNLLPVLRPQVGSPEVETPTVTNIGTFSAVVSTTALPFGFATSAALEYSTDSTFASSTTINLGNRSVDGSGAPIVLTAPLTGLSPRTEYFVRAIARNVAGESTSGTFSFTTLGSEPTVMSLITSDITGNEASVNTEIDPGLLFTTVRAQISSTAEFSNTSTNISLGTVHGESNGNLTGEFADLQPQHAYFIRVIATNELGTTYSEPISFTTVGSAPTVTSLTGSSTTNSVAATIDITTGSSRGTVTYQLSRSSTFSTIVHFDSHTFGSRGPTTSSFNTYGLSYATDYWVRAIVTNDLGSHTSNSMLVRTRGAAPEVGMLRVTPVLRGAQFSFSLDSTGISTMAVVDIADNGDMQNYTSHFAFSGNTNGAQTIFLAVDFLKPTIEYFARVSAINALGQRESNIVSFRTFRPLGLVINDDEVSTTNPHVTLNFRYPTDTVAVRVSNNEDFSGARIFLPASSIGWDLVTADDQDSTRTVYVQFISSTGKTTLYSDDISLETDVTVPDEEAPIITSLRAVTAQSMSVAGVATWATTPKNMRKFIVGVADKLSGVTRIQTKVGTRIVTQKVDSLRNGEYSVSFARSVKTFSIRVIDRSGNASKWRKIAVR